MSFLGNEPTSISAVTGTADRKTFIATAGQTVFQATYDVGFVDVYLNGVKLINGTDFTATDGANITLTVGAALNDTVNIIGFGTFELTGAGFGRKNALINGNMNIAQRGTSFTNISSTVFTLDRWTFSGGGGGTVDVTQSTDVPNKQSASSLKIDVNVVDASIAASDLYGFQQRIEGHNIQQFGFGESSANAVTLSFWVKSSLTGIYTISIRNIPPVDRSYIAEYTINVANTWEKKTITIPGETTGTWKLDNTVGFLLDFSLASGSAFEGTNNTWNIGNVQTTSNQVNFMATGTNAFLITQIQLETGITATDFEHVDFAVELAQAQRYYEKSYDVDTDPGTITFNGEIDVIVTSTSVRKWVPFAVEKRSTPTIVVYNPVLGTSGSWRNNSTGASPAVVGANVGTKAFLGFLGSGVAAGNIILGHYTADAEL